MTAGVLVLHAWWGLNDDVRAAAERLQSGRVAQFQVYPGTKHWFDEPSRPEFDKAASALAWDRTRAFLDQHLRR